MKVFWYSALLALALGWSLFWGLDDPGYVLINQGPRSLETTAFLAFWVILVLAVTSGWLLSTACQLLSLPKGLKSWHQRRMGRKGRKALTQALTQYVLLRRGAKSQGLAFAAEYYPDSPLALILYAEILVEQGDYETALGQLVSGEQRFPQSWELPALRCQKLIDMGRLDEATRLMLHIEHDHPKAPNAALLKYKLALAHHHTQEAEHWLNKVKKQQLLEPQELLALEVDFHCLRLKALLEPETDTAQPPQASTEPSDNAPQGLPAILSQNQANQRPATKLPTIKAWWKNLPKPLRVHSAIQNAYLEALLAADDEAQVMKLSEQWLPTLALAPLADAFKALPGDSHRIAILNRWWQRQPNTELALWLAQEHIKLEHWAEAQRLLEPLAQTGNAKAKKRLLALYLNSGQLVAAKHLFNQDATIIPE